MTPAGTSVPVASTTRTRVLPSGRPTDAGRPGSYRARTRAGQDSVDAYMLTVAAPGNMASSRSSEAGLIGALIVRTIRTEDRSRGAASCARSSARAMVGTSTMSSGLHRSIASRKSTARNSGSTRTVCGVLARGCTSRPSPALVAAGTECSTVRASPAGRPHSE